MATTHDEHKRLRQQIQQIDQELRTATGQQQANLEKRRQQVEFQLLALTASMGFNLRSDV